MFPDHDLKLCVILLAAGSSTRFRADPAAELGGDFAGAGLGARSKLDEDLGGRPVLHRALELFVDRPETTQTIVAGPSDPEQMDTFKLRHQDKLNVFGSLIVSGGKKTRAQSVAKALQHVDEACTHIAVHDAARPITPAAVIERTLDAARAGHAAVVPAVPVTDTVKRAESEDLDLGSDDPLAGILGAQSTPKARHVSSTVDRSRLFAVQTPQLFERQLLLRAYESAGETINDPAAATDDAALVEALGEQVLLVDGDPANIKLTTPADLVVARALGGFKPPRDRPSHLKF